MHINLVLLLNTFPVLNQNIYDHATRFGVRTKFCGIDDVKYYANPSHFGIFTRFILNIIILRNMPELKYVTDLI